jgi:hypothetical protein
MKAGLGPQLLVYFGEGFAADEAGFLLMLPGYIPKAMPDGSGKPRKKVKRPGMKKGVAPIMEGLEGAGIAIGEFAGKPE